MQKSIILLLLSLLLNQSLAQDPKNASSSSSSSAPVISRNTRIQEMIEGLKDQNDIYDEMINDTEKTLHFESNECHNRINELNCSNVEVWENLRRKHSKNITNLQDKMKKHNETIQQILKANIELVERKNASLMGLFPEVKKIKNDQEMIDILLMVIDDTYVRIEEIDLEPSEENSSTAVFILSEMEKELKEVGKFIEMRREGPPPSSSEDDDNSTMDLNSTNTTVFSNETTTESNETIIGDENETIMNETIFEDQNETIEGENETSEVDEPLIDEEIFDKEGETAETEDEDLFSKQNDDEKEEEEEVLTPDEIPEGKDVKEHDEQHLERVSQRNTTSSQTSNETAIQEHYNLKELKLSLISRVKQQGKEMFKELSELRKQLQEEQEDKLDQIQAYERAIFLIHQKHMHQIVQIYKENRNLYVQILEKDDAVMQLDAKINECRNIQEYEESCEEIKDSLQQFMEDSKSQINFNNAAIKELEKLLEYEDKNVFDPAYEEQAIKPTQGPMNKIYEDYSQTDNGELVKRTVVCKVTECREKRYQSEENFELLLTKKYDSFNEDQLLNEAQTQVDKGSQLDERFDIKEKNQDSIDENNSQREEKETVKEMKKEVHPLQVESMEPPEELEPISDDSLINEMKEKLSSDVGGPKNEEKPKEKVEKTQEQQLEKQKKNKKKIIKKAKIMKDHKKQIKKVQKKVKKSKKKQELTKPKEVVEEEQKEDSNIFKQAFHYLFGSKNTQGFSEIREVQNNQNVNGPLDFLAQFN